jgi:hypothetical protein
MPNKENKKLNKKTIAILALAVFMSSMVAFAAPGSSSSIPEPAVLAYAAVSSVAAMNFLASSANPAPSPEPVLIPTELAPAPNSPLAGLDLVPTTATVAYSYPSLKLDPGLSSMEYGQRYLIREYRSGVTGDVIFKVNLGVMVALNVADYFSTKACLQHAGLKEGNPLLKPFVKSPIAFAAAKVGMTALSYVALKSLYKKSKPAAWIISMASNLFLSYVVSSNLRLNALAR